MAAPVLRLPRCTQSYPTRVGPITFRFPHYLWASPSAKAGVLLGHSKLDTTALYVRVATKTIRSVTSPLERLALLMQGEDPGG